MLAVLFVALATASGPGALSEPGSCVVRPSAGVRGRLVAASGLPYEGKVVDVTGGFATIETGTGQVVRIPLDRVRTFITSECLDDRVPFGSLPPGAGPQTRIVLVDGTTLVGQIVERGDGRLVLEVDGARREVVRSEVLVEVAVHERPRPIGLVERHLESPTARPLRSGALHLSLNEGTHLVASYGITSWLAASAGTVLPTLYADALTTNWQLALQAAIPIGDHVHLAGGVHAFGGGGRTTGLLSAAVTWSSASWDVTLFAGPIFRGLAPLDGLDDDLGLALSATFHVTDSSSLLSENWTDFHLEQSFHLLAYRLAWDRFAGDLGVGFSSRGVYPWIGLTMEISP